MTGKHGWTIGAATIAALGCGGEPADSLTVVSWGGSYERPTYEEAKRDLKAMRAELDELNQSAVASLDEGFEETLTLHRLGVFPLVGRSLKTTNVLESVNAQAEQRCGRVDRWRNSNHKQRWLAAALIDIEPRLRRLLGYRHLECLRSRGSRRCRCSLGVFSGTALTDGDG